jgi:predicted metal-dependent peptidase
MDINAKLVKARTDLLMDEPFFGTLALRPDYIMSDDIPTAATDGKNFYFNPKFLSSLNRYEMAGLLAHEIAHNMLAHSHRMGDRNPKKWNIACDYAINPILVDSGFKLPKDGLLDTKYKDMSAEKIYDLLPDETDETKDSPSIGIVLKAKTESEAENQQAIAEIKISVAQAARAAKNCGKLPSHLSKLVDSLLEPQINWRERLRYCLGTVVKHDYSWMRPNRRFIAQNMYLPSLSSPGVGEIAVAIDTSGSINEDELNIFCSELNHLLDETQPSKVTVLYCDASIQAVEEYTADDLPISLKIRGGGGTKFSPVFEHLQNEPPKALIYFTDMCGEFPEEPDYPVFWLATSRLKAPFGETIPYER